MPDAPAAEFREVGNERMEMCALGSPKPDESAGSRRTGAAGRPKALCSRMPILPWTQTRRNRQGTPAGQCRRVPSPPGCTLLGPAPRIPSSGHAVFCSSARTGAVAGHHFSSGGQRNISCNSIVVSASLPAVQAGGLNAALPRAGPALFREGVIAFFSSSEVLRAAIGGGCLGPAAEVAVFSISEESGR